MRNQFIYRIGIIILLLLVASPLFAWQTLDGNGVAVCTVSGTQETPLLTTDGQGGVIIAWCDQRPDANNFDIYAQRLDSHGNPLWTDGGVAICTAENPQFVQGIASDGNGGAVIEWQDSRNDYDIYAQRVNSVGSTLWTDGGMAVCTAISNQLQSSMISDGSTFTMVWRDSRYTNGYGYDIFSQKIDLNGNSIWTTNGVGVCVEATNAYSEFNPALTSDGQGGAVFCWFGSVTGANYGIYYQRVNSNGSTLWSYPYGVPIRVLDDYEEAPLIVTDGNNGAIMAWADDRGGYSIFVQRVNSTGSTLWTLNGIDICTVNTAGLSNPTMISDGQGGAMITWQEARNGTNNIFVQRINSDGSTLWTDGGVLLCNAGNARNNPVIASDSSGGAIIVWVDSRYGNGAQDLFAQRVNSSGSTLWTINGVAICTAANDQINQNLVPDGQGGAFFAWQDYRNNTDYDIYAQSIYSTGSVTLPYPVFSQLPSLKLFNSQSLSTAFDLSDYVTVTPATTYSIISNFLSLSTLTGSLVGENSYSSSTVGTNTYEAANQNGYNDASNEVKYSYYKIYKLPHVGLTAGSSWDINVAKYTYNNYGSVLSSALPITPLIVPIYPPSFGNASALIVSDTTLVTATWLDSTSIQITSLPTYTSGGPVSVDVIASVYSDPPYADMDKERIWVYPNLLPNSTFSTANDISSGTYWGGSALEIPPGRTTLATESWVSSYTDSVGTEADGVVKFTFADANDGVKATPGVSNWINITNGQWYIFRMHVVADSANNNHQSFLFGYTNIPAGGVQTDIGANLFFGVPTVWTWQETPLLAHGSGTSGYPQFQLKAGGAGSIYVDEVQILNATPALLEARSNTKFHYLYGEFTAGSDTTGWGQQIYTGAAGYPGISVNNGLVLTFDGTAAEGIKWTANNNVQGPHAYSFPVSEGYDVNVGLTVTINSGSFNSLGFVLLAAYGVQTSGQQDIGVVPSNLIASAGVGIINSGTYYAEGQTINPYYQGQFGIRNDLAGVLTVTGVDVSTDNDDPNFGDPNLFQ